MSIVRIAGPADKEEIFRLLRAAHAESGLFDFDLPKVHWWIDRMLWPERLAPDDTAPRGLIGVIGDEGALEGLAFIVIGTIWYSSRPTHIEELTVYVEPEYRAAHAGAYHLTALINWMKEQARTINLPLMAGVMSTERTEAKIRMYRRVPEMLHVGAVFRFDPSITAGSSISLMVH